MGTCCLTGLGRLEVRRSDAPRSIPRTQSTGFESPGHRKPLDALPAAHSGISLYISAPCESQQVSQQRRSETAKSLLSAQPAAPEKALTCEQSVQFTQTNRRYMRQVRSPAPGFSSPVAGFDGGRRLARAARSGRDCRRQGGRDCVPAVRQASPLGPGLSRTHGCGHIDG